MQLRNVVVVDGARSAFARGGRGKLLATRLDDAPGWEQLVVAPETAEELAAVE